MRRPRRWRPPPPKRKIPPPKSIDSATPTDPLAITMHPEVLRALRLGVEIEDTRDLARALNQPEDWAADFRQVTNARPRTDR